MATMFYDKDADIDLIRARKVAVIGYGSQGHAHALNMKDSGVDVVVGLAAGSKSIDKATAAGLRVMTVAEASKWADVIMVLVPDQHQARIYKAEIEPHLAGSGTIRFKASAPIPVDLVRRIVEIRVRENDARAKA